MVTDFLTEIIDEPPMTFCIFSLHLLCGLLLEPPQSFDELLCALPRITTDWPQFRRENGREPISSGESASVPYLWPISKRFVLGQLSFANINSKPRDYLQKRILFVAQPCKYILPGVRD